MALPSVFSKQTTDELISRINKLNANSTPSWGKMSVDKMFAHCNVTYEMVYENIHPKPNFFVSLLLKAFVKNTVVSEKPYKNNSQTAPAFIISDARNFEKEKTRLIDYILKTQALGSAYFDKKESLSFGVLTIEEWNNMFYKHLDHHLVQFNV